MQHPFQKQTDQSSVAENALLAREQFAVSLRQKRKKEIITQRRCKLANRKKTTIVRQQMEEAKTTQKPQPIREMSLQQICDQISQCPISETQNLTKLLVILSFDLYKMLGLSQENEVVAFSSIAERDVQEFIQNVDNVQLLFGLLRDLGTPLDES